MTFSKITFLGAVMAASCLLGSGAQASKLAVVDQSSLYSIGSNNQAYESLNDINSNWTARTSLGGAFKQLEVVRNMDGLLELFGIGSNDYVYQKSQLANGTWSAWKNTWDANTPAIKASHIAVADYLNSTVVYAVNKEDGSPWLRIQDKLKASGNWSAWAPMNYAAAGDVPTSKPALQKIYVSPDEQSWSSIFVFGVGQNNAPYSIDSTDARRKFSGKGWQPVGLGVVKELQPNGSGPTWTLYGIGTNGYLYAIERYRTSSQIDYLSSWQLVTNQFQVRKSTTYSNHLFVIKESDGSVAHSTWSFDLGKKGNTWGAFENLGGSGFVDIKAVVNKDGLIDIVAIDATGKVQYSHPPYTSWQLIP